MVSLDELNDVFKEVFDDDDIAVNQATTANDVDGWDSLSHVNLIVAIESRFKIRFSHRELLSFKNVGEMLNCIITKVAA